MAWSGPTSHSDAARRIREHDWTTTRLGPLAGWPQSLRTALELCLESAFPAVLWWGPELYQFHNDAARLLLDVTASVLGASARETWAAEWSELGPVLEQVVRTGQAVRRDDQALLAGRAVRRRPAWFTCCYNPVRDESGRVAGVFCHVVETTVHVNAEAALRESQSQLAMELTDTQQLHRISNRYIRDGGNIDVLYVEILDVARALVHADMASLQRLVPERQALFLLAHQGFAPESAAFWEWVQADHTTTCGVALARSEAVVVADVETWEPAAGSEDLEHYRRCGIRAILSVPLLARNQRLVGMISTHWRQVHEPSARELRVLDLLARQAADLIERRLAADTLKQHQEVLRLAEERQAFLLTLSDAIRPLIDPVAIEEVATRILGESLHASRAVYAEFLTEGGRDIVLVEREYRVAGAASFIGRHAAERFGADVDEFQAGRAVVVDDTELEAGSDEVKATWRALGVRARMGVPLVKGGRLVGAVELHDTNPRTWTAAEVALVVEVGERTWAAVERARSEAALRVSEERFRMLFDSIDEGFAVINILWDRNGAAGDYQFVSVNRAFARHTGLHDVVGKYGRDIDRPVERYWLETYGEVARTGIPQRFENYHQATGRWYLVYASRFGGGDSRQVALVFADITERKRTEAVLRESEQRQTFLLTLADALRPVGDARAIERDACRILGDFIDADHTYYAELDVGRDHGIVRYDYVRNGATAFVAGHRLSWLTSAVPLDSQGRPVVVDDVHRSPLIPDVDRGTTAASHAAWIASPVVKDGRPVAVLCVAMRGVRAWTDSERDLVADTAERVWAAIERSRAAVALRDSEERLRRLNEELEQRVRARTAEIDALFKRLVRAQEDERRRLARDVHDHLGQQMTALRMQLEVLRSTMRRQPSAAGIQRVERIAEELDRSIDSLTWQLRPAALDHLGLPAALRHLVSGWSERFGVSAEFSPSGVDGVRLPPDVEANLYRLAQEALHNIVKHARSRQVRVGLSRRDDRLVLTVADDGVGFNVADQARVAAGSRERADPGLAQPASSGRSMGLVNMRERAALVGGELAIDSEPGRGTTVTVELPLPRVDAEGADG